MQIYLAVGVDLQVGSLEAVARTKVEAALAPLRGAWAPGLPDWLAAFNGALSAALGRIRCARHPCIRVPAALVPAQTEGLQVLVGRCLTLQVCSSLARIEPRMRVRKSVRLTEDSGALGGTLRTAAHGPRPPYTRRHHPQPFACRRCSAARRSTAARWGWPPPELAAALPLRAPGGSGGAGDGTSKRLRTACGQSAADAQQHSNRQVPPMAASSDWHAAETEAALAAALQAAALPPALDGAAAGELCNSWSGSDWPVCYIDVVRCPH